MSRLIGLIGILVIFGLAFLMSNNRKAINYKTIGVGFILQIFFAIFIFKVPIGQKIFMDLGEFVAKILDFATDGGVFVFGPLMEKAKLTLVWGSDANIFALQLVASMIFMMILVNILYYYGVIQRIIPILGRAMNKLMKVSGAEALSNVASAFVGNVSAQIMIRPYLEKLSRSELLASMAGSLACVSGAMMPIYISMGVPATYVLASSIMAVPGAFVISKIVYPETKIPETGENFTIQYNKRKKPYINVFDAISQGAAEGMKVALNIVAMILALIALVAMIDWFLGLFGAFCLKIIPLHKGVIGYYALNHLSLHYILGKLFAIFAIILGVPLKEATAVGGVMGTKLVLNEMVGFFDLIHIQGLSPKAFLIGCFTLCNFSNFGSVAIQLGGIGELAPNQRKNLARLGVRALICGTLTGYMSAAIVGVLF
ncbi:MAG: nucleoside transporter C-terminal domain-containing protein [Cyanobacteriota bacterium]|nr:nucleoside transporter C-terminal domain-containing protein [Cyanobacteriota bacterium]MDY6358516.1 nucleoside transporter C-terminal domain-containing protein [Cyanobacteriota bacterium]MDY6364196.1 nucleoside transporter C-terminal domain-containing protein [Cyanobacteriota bacterium]MDY6383647.1 nucleoside transporter C-terminal domain-containing protein [Cyanobacteriota bacterium]